MIEKAHSSSKSRSIFQYPRSNAREIHHDDDIIRYTDSYEVQKQSSKSKFQHVAQKFSWTSSIGSAKSASFESHKHAHSGSTSGNGSCDESEVKINPWLAVKPTVSFNRTSSIRSQGNKVSFYINPGNESPPEERTESDAKSSDQTKVNRDIEDAPGVTGNDASPLNIEYIDSHPTNLSSVSTLSGPFNSMIILSQSALTDDEEIDTSLRQSVTQTIKMRDGDPVHEEIGYEVFDFRPDLCVQEVVLSESAPLGGPKFYLVSKNDVNETSVKCVHGAQPPPESGLVGKVANGAKKNMLHAYGSCLGCTAEVADRVLDDETNEIRSNTTLGSALNSTTDDSDPLIDEQVHDVLMLVGGCLYKCLPEPGEKAMNVGASMLDLAVDISEAKFL
ncbi:hypothetical protein HJC23_000860 [Cyclotella cryptica]|uniref:Uncharacterized protein n=1 Tax=Cyclotella cryptica TaxID=29204 RepID=A0ABD3PSZ0_9STRA|eukprot:CCRYP_011566-RA/>CCRYP_011566-RA protein AED:0.41 eAED:0.41 QI:0/-1/0/1/-1/1/1/0/389